MNHDYYRQYSWLIIFRNIIFAPIAEEIVFRGLIVPLIFVHYKNISTSQDLMGNTHYYSHLHLLVIITSPIYFGIAHIHHFYENIRSGRSFWNAFIVTLSQMTYTSIFGCVAVILFLRTGNIISPITSHIFCNIQGLPSLDFMIKPGDPYESGELSCLYPFRVVILLSHALGLIIFALIIYPSTQSLCELSPYYFS